MSGRSKGGHPPAGADEISPEQWGDFLLKLNEWHHAWLVRLETHDLVTQEKVQSQEMPLESLELDLEDQENPRINVTVHDGNKTIKHILFRPSRLVFRSRADTEKLLQVETVNTETAIRFRLPAVGDT